MAINSEQKTNIRTYYETHYDEIKDVAEKFSVSQRTLYDWIKKEGWQAGKFAKKGDDFIKSEFTQIAIGSKLDYAKQSVANEIKSGFNELGVEYSEDIVNTRAEELLFEAMSIGYIDKSMAETAVLAKSNLKELVNSGAKPEKVIAASKDVLNIFAELKRSIHGKEPNNVINIANFTAGSLSPADMASLSDEELTQIIIEAQANENNK